MKIGDHSTKDEIFFLDGVIKQDISRERIVKILRGYSKTALSRSWPEGVNAKTVKSYADSLLTKFKNIK